MNRELKFRAWDIGHTNGEGTKTRSRMISWDTVQHMTMHTFQNGKDGRYSFMQYTGLKDKNGKDVYEGDLYTMPPNDDKSKLYEVKYEHSGFHLPNSEYMEVVGNVWES